MLKRMSRSLAMFVVALPLTLQPALAAPPTVHMQAPGVTAQADVILVSQRLCTKKIRTNCMEGTARVNKNSKAYKRQQAQANARLAQGMAVVGTIAVLGILGAAANRNYGGSGYSNGYNGGGNYRPSGGRRCNSFYTTPNPVPGQSCY